MQGTLLQSLISGKTAWLQARHVVLAQNVANADTPDFRPRDMVEESFDKLVARTERRSHGIELSRTDAHHIPAVGSTRLDGEGRKVDGFETAPAGNSVILEEQAEKMQQVQIDHQLTTNIYAKMVKLMKTAIGTGT
ncbi:MAG: flagellar basal body rod protein FlgB [Geminicoccaceae bacterium]